MGLLPIFQIIKRWDEIKLTYVVVFTSISQCKWTKVSISSQKEGELGMFEFFVSLSAYKFSLRN